MHILLFGPVVDDLSVLVAKNDMVAAILRERDLDGDPLIVRDEEGLRL